MTRTISAVFAVLLLAGCSSEPDWQDTYRSQLQGEYDAMGAVDKTQVCATIGSMTDSDLRLLFADQAGSGGRFEQLIAEQGRKPTADEYQAAVGIAIDKARENCE